MFISGFKDILNVANRIKSKISDIRARKFDKNSEVETNRFIRKSLSLKSIKPETALETMMTTFAQNEDVYGKNKIQKIIQKVEEKTGISVSNFSKIQNLETQSVTGGGGGGTRSNNTNVDNLMKKKIFPSQIRDQNFKKASTFKRQGPTP